MSKPAQPLLTCLARKYCLRTVVTRNTETQTCGSGMHWLRRTTPRSDLLGAVCDKALLCEGQRSGQCAIEFFLSCPPGVSNLPGAFIPSLHRVYLPGRYRSVLLQALPSTARTVQSIVEYSQTSGTARCGLNVDREGAGTAGSIMGHHCAVRTRLIRLSPCGESMHEPIRWCVPGRV